MAGYWWFFCASHGSVLGNKQVESLRQTMLSALLPLLMGTTLVGLATVLMLKPALSPQAGGQFLDNAQPLLKPMPNQTSLTQSLTAGTSPGIVIQTPVTASQLPTQPVLLTTNSSSTLTTGPVKVSLQ